MALFQELAPEYRLYIVGGSHPHRADGQFVQRGPSVLRPPATCTRRTSCTSPPTSGKCGMCSRAKKIKVFETPLARVAIQICYDIEFPETARLLAMAGVEAIFVPFSTDEKKAYYRVRYSAHARAVENYLYLVLAGSAGNLPTTPSYLLNYSQSAIITPSDFAFPLEATAALADPNVETVVIADLDLNSLAQQREMGSVRPLHDRRPDLYELRAKIPIQNHIC